MKLRWPKFEWTKSGLWIFAIASLMLLVNANASGSYGLNKVQYHPFGWRGISTKHFDIWFHQDGDSLAAYTAREMEAIYDSTSKFMGTTLRQRIPVILHNTHAQFQQTNVIRYPLPEAVGGFTEIFKNRIVLPFDGSYASFHHVLHHEFVHALTFDMLSAGGRGLQTAQRMAGFPLWFSEGLAEIASLDWDIASEFYMIDAVTNGYVVSPIYDFGGFLAYKGGQSFLVFLEQAWGPGTVRTILREVERGYNFEGAFRRATRTSLDEAGELWLREIRRIYWPELGNRQHGKSIARAMTDHRRDQSYYNVAPAISPDGSRIAFFSDRGNWESVVILDTRTEKIETTALEGGNTGAHESFSSFTSNMGWAPDNQHLALVSLQGGRHVIHILDTKKSKVVQVLKPDLERIGSPSFSPDGKRIFFSGQKASMQDLYSLGRDGKGLTRHTTGRTAEDKPVVSPSGRFVAFESDSLADARARYIRQKKDVFVLDLQTGNTTRICNSRWSSSMPAWGPADSLLSFVSNRSGVDQVYLQQLRFSGDTITSTDSLWAITNLLSSVTHPTWTKDGSAMAFSLFEAGGFDVYLLKSPLDKRQPGPLPRTLFVQVAEDSTGITPFFAPIPFENLRTYDDTTAFDSLAKEMRDPERMGPITEDGESIWNPPAEEGLFIDPPELIAPKKDTAQSPTPSDSAESTKYVSKPDTTTKPVTAADSALQAKIFSDRSAFNAQGALNVYPYRPQWSLDQAVAMAGFSNVGGVGGQGALSFTDLMGDQQIDLWFFSGGGSIDNLNLYVAYEYLPLRPDLGLRYLRTSREGREELSYARFLQLRSVPADSIPEGAEEEWGYTSYRDVTTALGTGVRFPFSLYSRVDADVELAYRTRRYQEYDDDGNLKDDPDMQSQDLNSVGLTLGWSFDNAQWGITGPVLGQRLWLGGQVVPPWMLQSEVGYWKVDGDMRRYFHFFKKYTVALRAAGGMSEALGEARNPHVYLVGGDDWTVNWHFNERNYLGSQDEVVFSSWETPVRGYRYHEFRGSRMAIFNMEFRYPFIDEFRVAWPIPFAFRNITGALFADLGGTWDDDRFLEDRGAGIGWGAQMNLGVFVLRYTKAWSLDEIGTVPQPGSRVYWSLGASF